MPVIAYQGEPGAFSDHAARTLVPDAQTLGFGTFDAAVAAVQNERARYAFLPAENSISGTVPRVYDLLWADARLSIVDEISYRVIQNLIGLAGADVATLREVRSHPVALEQCRTFLAKHAHLRATIAADTAGAVRDIVESGDASLAAIGSTLAAERYGARVLRAGIQDVHDNFTRFFLLARDASPGASPTRACVALSLPNRPGSLRDALGAFADEGLDLRTLVSRPSLERPFTYRFYCEIAPVAEGALDRALTQIDGEARVLGRY